MTITTIKKNISEEAMVDAFLQSGHFKTAKLYKEIPVFSRCVDLVVLNGKNQLTAIEFKKEKWKDAIDQLLRVSTSFDFLEMCILEPSHEELKKEIICQCEQFGFGVYFMNPMTMKVRKVLSPQKSDAMWKTQKREVRKYLEGRS